MDRTPSPSEIPVAPQPVAWNWIPAVLALGGLGVLWFFPSHRHTATSLIIAGVAGFLILILRQAASTVQLTQELTQQRRRTELIELQRLRQRQLVDSLSDGLEVAILLCDQRGMVDYANRRAIELFRFESPIGRTLLAVTLSHELEELIGRAVSTRAPQSAEIVFRYPEERIGQAKAWIQPEVEDRVFLSVYDVTNLRRLERVRRDFVANVSHELRTPMTSIRAMAETLQDEEPASDPLFERYLKRIIAEVDRLTLISDDLLTLGRAESTPVTKQPVWFDQVIQSVVAQLDDKARDRQLTLTFTSCEPTLVQADAYQLTQVVMNLVDNALNYTNEGGVTLTLEQDEDGTRLHVRDTGIGIAQEHQPRVFERFYRVDKGRSRQSGGTGLGLAIVRHILEAHGGSVRLESALHKGSTFTVALPDRPPSPEDDPGMTED